jgi:probable selenium-dependent hydroxylase accessory protein YqeC
MSQVSIARNTGLAVSLIDALDARAGIVCFVGAGGKKTTIGRLARLHPGRVGISSSTKIPPLPTDIEALRLALDDGDDNSFAARTGGNRCIIFSGPQVRADRFGGLEPARIARLHGAGQFAVTYVKADGARMRLIKTPGPGEPQLVPGCRTIVPVLSVHAIGRRLDNLVAHRPEQVAATAGISVGTTIDAAAMARVMAHYCAVLAERSGASIVPLLNMADNETLAAAATEIAALTLRFARGIPRIVITSLIAADPIVSIVNVRRG